jgi:hypothetical protein
MVARASWAAVRRRWASCQSLPLPLDYREDEVGLLLVFGGVLGPLRLHLPGLVRLLVEVARGVHRPLKDRKPPPDEAGDRRAERADERAGQRSLRSRRYSGCPASMAHGARPFTTTGLPGAVLAAGVGGGTAAAAVADCRSSEQAGVCAFGRRHTHGWIVAHVAGIGLRSTRQPLMAAVGASVLASDADFDDRRAPSRRPMAPTRRSVATSGTPSPTERERPARCPRDRWQPRCP